MASIPYHQSDQLYQQQQQQQLQQQQQMESGTESLGPLTNILNELIQLKIFLSIAPNNLSGRQGIYRHTLPNKEQISCVVWRNIYFITGTDIVRCLSFRFEAFGREITNRKKFEEGIFSDLRNLKCETDAVLEQPKSEFLEFLYRNNCVRTQKKQKIFFWYSVNHDRLFQDALERDLKKELANNQPSTTAVRDPALSFQYDSSRTLHDQLPEIIKKFPRHLADLADASSIMSSTINMPSGQVIQIPSQYYPPMPQMGPIPGMPPHDLMGAPQYMAGAPLPPGIHPMHAQHPAFAAAAAAQMAVAVGNGVHPGSMPPGSVPMLIGQPPVLQSSGMNPYMPQEMMMPTEQAMIQTVDGSFIPYSIFAAQQQQQQQQQYATMPIINQMGNVQTLPSSTTGPSNNITTTSDNVSTNAAPSNTSTTNATNNTSTAPQLVQPVDFSNFSVDVQDIDKDDKQNSSTTKQEEIQSDFPLDYVSQVDNPKYDSGDIKPEPPVSYDESQFRVMYQQDENGLYTPILVPIAEQPQVQLQQPQKTTVAYSPDHDGNSTNNNQSSNDSLSNNNNNSSGGDSSHSALYPKTLRNKISKANISGSTVKQFNNGTTVHNNNINRQQRAVSNHIMNQLASSGTSGNSNSASGTNNSRSQINNSASYGTNNQSPNNNSNSNNTNNTNNNNNNSSEYPTHSTSFFIPTPSESGCSEYPHEFDVSEMGSPMTSFRKNATTQHVQLQMKDNNKYSAGRDNNVVSGNRTTSGGSIVMSSNMASGNVATSMSSAVTSSGQQQGMDELLYMNEDLNGYRMYPGQDEF